MPEIFRYDPFWAATGAALPRRPRSVGQTAVAFPYQFNSPTDALIDIKVRRRLGRFIPIWLNVGTLDTIAHLRIARVLQRRPACWFDARRLWLHPDVLQYVADVGAVGDEGDHAHPRLRRAGTAVGRPRRCGWSAPPTECAPGVRAE